MSPATAAPTASITTSAAICGHSCLVSAVLPKSIPGASFSASSRFRTAITRRPTSLSAAPTISTSISRGQRAGPSGASRRPIPDSLAQEVYACRRSPEGSIEMSNQADIDGLRRQLALTIHAHWKLFLAQGIVMMVLGLLSVVGPILATLAVEIFVGWLFFVAGLFRAVWVWRSREMPGFAWSFLAAVLAIILGVILILRPLAGVLTLTMVLVAFFVIEGIASIIGAIEHRQHLRSWGWVLFSGIIDLLLAYLIWQGWPSSASWAIGLLVGINMLFLGLSLVMTALAARVMGNQ